MDYIYRGTDNDHSSRVIRVFPEQGHPSSLWPSSDLIINQSRQPYVLPSQIGVGEELERRILAWTDTFQKFFMEKPDNFGSRPIWRPGLNIFDWYDEGYQIVGELRAHFPDVQIRPEFAQYVFSVNERREHMGLMPISPPGTYQAGHISISDMDLTSGW